MTLSDKLAIDVSAIEEDAANHSFVSVYVDNSNANALLKHLIRECLPRPVAPGLLTLRAIYFGKTNADLFAIRGQERKAVAVLNADHAPVELIGGNRGRTERNQDQKDERFHACASW